MDGGEEIEKARVGEKGRKEGVGGGRDFYLQLVLYTKINSKLNVKPKIINS